MKQSKSTLKKIKLMIPLVLMTAVLGACSANASSSTASSTTQAANATSTSQTKTITLHQKTQTLLMMSLRRRLSA